MSSVWATNLHFSTPPTAEEISGARLFENPLLPGTGTSGAGENQALVDALTAYSARTNAEDFSSLTGFLTDHPNSPWNGTLFLDLGTEYYRHGYYSKALSAWEAAWPSLADVKTGRTKPLADLALGELARMYSKLGRVTELSNLLNSVADRNLTGPATQLIHSARQALYLMNNRPGICFKCGPLALDLILRQQDPSKLTNSLIFQSQSTTQGFSLSQVQDLAGRIGMNYQAAYRSPGAPWIVPAVIHWKLGHYAAVLRQDGNRFLVRDYTFQSGLWMSKEALEEESSGYFLIPSGELPAGWRMASTSECQNVWGRGLVSGQDPNYTTQEDLQDGGDPYDGNDDPDDPGNTDSDGEGDPGSPSQDSGCSPPMTTYTFHTMLASLSLNDTPLSYKPPVGPWIRFTATYNQNEANQASGGGMLGPGWTCNWGGYLNVSTYYPTCSKPGGGTMTFSISDSESGIDPATQAVLTFTVAQVTNSFETVQFRNGVTWTFGLPVYTCQSGGQGEVCTVIGWFLTKISDSAGNSVTWNYDGNGRMTNIVDAIGQATVLNYADTNNPSAITSVRDPFGRTANFQYNSSHQLSQITDVLGITSQYTYGSNDFINALTTPYGTTTFTTGETNGGSWIMATDPLGEKELMEAPLTPLTGTASDPTNSVPTNMVTYNQYLNYRNTYFWGKNASADAGILSDATVYHFLHEENESIESGTLECEKRPLENRVWYDYPNQVNGYQLNSNSICRPSVVGRVLDNGSTQLRSYQYSANGHVTNATDPLGRNFTYVYSTNGIDLLQAIMTSNGRSEVQSTSTYNSQHRPLTITDASGQTTTNTYNSRGQILSTTDPLGEKTTFAYDTNGYLSLVTGPLQNTNDVVTYTYDSFGRVHTLTDTTGYTLAYFYDAANRVTNITYPDGSYEQFVYTLLDLTASRDRLGRWSTNTYDADRHLVSTLDPLGRATQFQYCNCGSLEAIIDPAGNPTWWDHDIQGRLTAKHYADNSTITYTYENTTSRLFSRLDEAGQQTIYQYYNDNDPASVSYSNAIVPTPTVSYVYDTNYDRIVSMQDGIGTTTYTYNPVINPPGLGGSLLASITGPLPNAIVTYQYDQLERITNRAIDGVAQTIALDMLGRPTTVTNALGTFHYAYVGTTPRLASAFYPNGQSTRYSYYPTIGDERLLQIQNFYPNGSLLSAYGYSYNAIGQIVMWTNQWDTLPTRVWYPTYDAVDQLTDVAVTGGNGLVSDYSYAYDMAGNRTEVGTNGIATQSYYNSLNQLASSKGTFTDVSYEWDAENRLVAIKRGTNSTRFDYDGFGRCTQIAEITGGIVTSNIYYLWCGPEVCERRAGLATNVQRRLYPQGEIFFETAAVTNFYYTRDHLGSVREFLDSTASIDARYDYDPYGVCSMITGNPDSETGFAGYNYFTPSGHAFVMHRVYDPGSARWLSRDPIEEAGGMNLYCYVGNNPINAVDPLGLYRFAWPLGPAGGSCTAQSVASMFMQNPNSYFPFVVSGSGGGSSSIVLGQHYNLSGVFFAPFAELGKLGGPGWGVTVTGVTDTGFTFTTDPSTPESPTSPGPNATIQFDIVNNGGILYLTQTGLSAGGTEPPLMEAMGANLAWNWQAFNFQFFGTCGGH